MKIVFVVTGLSIGGAEIMLLKVLERLDARFLPHVISLSTLGEIGPSIQKLGIPAEELLMRPGLPSPIAVFRLMRRIKSLKPDVVHTWMYHADLLGGLAARLAGVRALGWCIRNGNLDRNKTKLSTRLMVDACAWLSHWLPDKILSCSEAARQIHVDYGYMADKFVVVPNGFDLGYFQQDFLARAAVLSELGVRMDTPLVGMIGRFDPQKNHAGFFNMAGLLHRRMPEIQFVLAGTRIDEANGDLMRMVEAAGVRQVTHLLGFRDDVHRLMTALDVLVSSSYGEAFPNVLGEAMACGVPCAVTNVGDSTYIVGDTGHIVAPGDMVGLATAVESLLLLTMDERRALGMRARTRVAEHFEIGQVVKRYEAFYDELAAKGLSKRMVTR